MPRASRSEIVGEHDGALRVRIAAPPVDGAANDELVRLLARAFGVGRGAAAITAGQTGKLKTVQSDPRSTRGVGDSAVTFLANSNQQSANGISQPHTSFALVLVSPDCEWLMVDDCSAVC